jgi:hypothetical protein
LFGRTKAQKWHMQAQNGLKWKQMEIKMIKAQGRHNSVTNRAQISLKGTKQ